MHASMWLLIVTAAGAAACSNVRRLSEETDGTNAGTGGTSAGTSGTNAGTSGANAGTASSGKGGQSGAESSDCNRTEPINHRPREEVCDSTRPPSMPAVDSGMASLDAGFVPSSSYCTSDEQCTSGVNGRCESFRDDPRCTYDECSRDSECDWGGPCGCERAFWSDANACLEGNCQTDADCGSQGFCSPTLGECGNYAGVIGYYCHTCEDECVNDADCTAGDCRYSPEVGHWACASSHCVG